MRGPRPTLLINNAEDSCCFRAPLVKPYFVVYSAQGDFQFHQITDPGYHNYKLDNRQQSYRFFDKYFHLSASDKGIPVDSQIKTYLQLAIGLPPDNLTILGLARELAGRIRHEPIPAPGSRAEWAAPVLPSHRPSGNGKPGLSSAASRHVW